MASEGRATINHATLRRREGVELTAGFTAVINATLRVGGVEETVTVSGASPIVDTVNVRTQNVLSHETLEALPTAKGMPGLSALTLGTVGAIQDVGGNRAETPASFSFHGSRNTDQRIKYDGMSMNSFHTTGGGPNRLMLLNQVAIQEMVLETSGISAESETGGVQVNAVPREGGNRFRVSVLANFANDALQSTNVTPELTALGLTTPPSVKKIYDLGLGVGGPIRRDKLWFYSANRRWGAEESPANVYWNATPEYTFLCARLESARVRRQQLGRLWCSIHVAGGGEAQAFVLGECSAVLRMPVGPDGKPHARCVRRFPLWRVRRY